MENKAVVYGKYVYEIGKHYLFSLNELDWTYGILTALNRSYKKCFCTKNEAWLYIKEISNATNGTITPAPVELISGTAYVFDINHSTHIGFYDTSQKAFFYSMFKGAPVASLKDCANIREMTVKDGG